MMFRSWGKTRISVERDPICTYNLFILFIFIGLLHVDGIAIASEGKIKTRMSREGDWMCGACHHLNFKKRDSCQRCSCPKYATESDVSSYADELQKTEILAGDWYCGALNCGVHNYASRTSCFKCGALKDYYGYGAAVVASAGYGYDSIPGWKNGDWICSTMGCGMHNYASRTECYKCRTPRDCGGAM